MTKKESDKRAPADIRYDIPQEGDSWNPEYFFSSYTRQEALASLDLAKPEDRNKFYDILADPNAKMLGREGLAKAKKNLVDMAKGGLIQNSLKNIDGLVKLVSEEDSTKASLSFPSFCCENSSDKYRATTNAINNFQEVSMAIKNDPKTYFAKKLDGASEISKMFWASLFKEKLIADQSIAQRQAFEALKAYGSPQGYLAENVNNGIRLLMEFKEEWAKLGEEKKVALEEKKRKVGGTLTIEEEYEFDKSFEEKEKGLLEKYKQGATASKAITQMVEEIQKRAYESLKKQQEEEKAKKK